MRAEFRSGGFGKKEGGLSLITRPDGRLAATVFEWSGGRIVTGPSGELLATEIKR